MVAIIMLRYYINWVDNSESIYWSSFRMSFYSRTAYVLAIQRRNARYFWFTEENIIPYSEYYFIISSFEYMEKRVRVTYYSFISNYDGSIKLVSWLVQTVTWQRISRGCYKVKSSYTKLYIYIKFMKKKKKKRKKETC